MAVSPTPPRIIRRAHLLWPTNIRSGMWAWLFHRISGLALVFYLFLHLMVLSSATAGPAAFDRAMEELHSPLFLALDLLLLLAVLYHGLNGIRVVLFDLGLGVRRQAALFWMVMVLTALVLLAAVAVTWPFLFGGGRAG
ncbi:MAG: succinate dehydrogenase, cytochrome b556 subunit [Firmicutes bacterium]|nr:succinate dehydrogenase, cytochrome b556 subunit [Bacillota bacterium]